ncbi:hypothetical protein ACO2Q8_01640 [Larkinella sp. VNQ87]|uniref:hypothetical protein n=1 Tax=Larkinella sp. VNQ87 TaxID=3400921 RepID=UPI003C099216
MRRVAQFILLAGGLFFFGSLTWAQSVRGSLGIFQLGYLNAPQAGMAAQSFAPDWFPRLNDHFVYSGAEGWFRMNRIMLGVSASALNARTVSARQTRLQRVGGLGQIKAGYVLFDNRRWLLYSAIGQGFSSAMVTLQQPDNDPITWMLSSHTTDFSIQIQKRFAAKNSPKTNKIRGLWMGLRLGYLASAKSALWQTIPDASPPVIKPAYALNGFYATLTLGGGRFQYKTP